MHFASFKGNTSKSQFYFLEILELSLFFATNCKGAQLLRIYTFLPSEQILLRKPLLIVNAAQRRRTKSSELLTDIP